MSVNAPIDFETLLAPDTENTLNGRNGSNALARFERLLGFCAAVADMLSIVLALLLAYGVSQLLQLGKQLHYPINTLILWALLYGFVFVALLRARDGYRPWNSMLQVKETENILRVSVITFLFIFALSLFGGYYISRWLMALAFLAVPLALAVERQLVYEGIRWLHTRGYGIQRILIYGAGSTGRRIFTTLVRSPRLGLKPIAFVDDDLSRAGAAISEASYTQRRSIRVIPGPLTREVVQKSHVGHVVIAIPSIGREKLMSIAAETAAAGATFSFVPQHFAPSDHWVEYEDIDGVLLASYRAPESSSSYQRFKRLFDFVVALTTLLLISPLFLFAILLIRLTSPGPGLFVQERVGKDGQRFKIYKFRTMYQDSEQYDYSPRSNTDSRITAVGRYLRRTSFDEIPQLLNVLRGDMSLVGPRPEMPFIVDSYGPLHRERLRVTPGITGLWQLSADRAYLIHDNMEYDLYYIRNRNFFMDMAILLHTLIFAARGI